jgi:hypothetical protein
MTSSHLFGIIEVGSRLDGQGEKQGIIFIALDLYRDKETREKDGQMQSPGG